MAVVAPEEAAAMFARNPELASAHPDVLAKVTQAVAAKQGAEKATKTAVQATQRAHTAVTSSPAGPKLGIGKIALAPDSISKTAGVKTGGGQVLVRLVFAVIAFIVALEIASQISGRYFSWNLGQGAQKLSDAASYIGLYPGQIDKLAQAKQAASGKSA
jgi:hypothetical protein